MHHDVKPGTAFWACAVVTLLSALVSAGYSIAALTGIGATDVFAWYAASRSIALASAVVTAMLLRSHRGVLALGLVMGLVQTFDAVIGYRLHEPAKAFGPLAFAVLNYVTLVALHRSTRALQAAA